jgi:hypothetical protein
LTEFRSFTLPFLQGTAPTRLPGARLTTYQVNRPKERAFSAWREEAKADGFEDRAFVYSCDEPEFFPVYGDPDDNWKLCRAALEQDRQTWPEAPKLVTTHIQSSWPHRANNLFDVMVINVELLDRPANSPFCVGSQRALYDASWGTLLVPSNCGCIRLAAAMAALAMTTPTPTDGRATTSTRLLPRRGPWRGWPSAMT